MYLLPFYYNLFISNAYLNFWWVLNNWLRILRNSLWNLVNKCDSNSIGTVKISTWGVKKQEYFFHIILWLHVRALNLLSLGFVSSCSKASNGDKRKPWRCSIAWGLNWRNHKTIKNLKFWRKVPKLILIWWEQVILKMITPEPER